MKPIITRQMQRLQTARDGHHEQTPANQPIQATYINSSDPETGPGADVDPQDPHVYDDVDLTTSETDSIHVHSPLSHTPSLPPRSPFPATPRRQLILQSFLTHGPTLDDLFTLNSSATTSPLSCRSLVSYHAPPLRSPAPSLGIYVPRAVQSPQTSLASPLSQSSNVSSGGFNFPPGVDDSEYERPIMGEDTYDSIE